MAITFDNSGKPTYMFQSGATSTDGVWFAVAGKVDTAAGYEWGGTQTFLNTVTTDATVILRDGFNNFLNPAARDAAITSPIQGTLAFLRQDAGGNTINQIQYYNGSAWVANDGDISGVTAGTGLSGGGTAGTITLSVDTAVVATTNNTLTMSNKTLTSPVISSIVNTGTLTLPTSTDTIVGRATTDTLTNKTIALGSNTVSGTTAEFNTALTDGDFATLAGSETLTNKTLTTPILNQPVLVSPEERLNISATAATGTVNLDTLTSGSWYYTSNATGNWVLNVRGSSSTSLDSILTTGDSITVAFLATQGASAYYQTSLQVDGTTSGVTVEWQGGTAPAAGNASGIDVYLFNIIKTASATFTVLASQTKFA